MAASVSVCMIHAFDPRGDKVGGVETFVRDYISYLPPDINLLLVGVDQIGDLPLGHVTPLTFRGKVFDFMPVMRASRSEDNVYATKIWRSLTLRFLLALFRYLGPLRRYVTTNNSSIELRRMEHFPIAAALRAPFIQMLHDGKTKDKAMSSLISRYWWINELAERLSLSWCTRFFCVSDELTNRLRQQYPKFSGKLETLTTWGNPSIFKTTPFKTDQDTIRVVYAGRLDDFKRPDVMFSIISRANELSPLPLRFHYIGDGDCDKFEEFEKIRDITILEGKRSAEEVASIYSFCHVGILTSDFEGMPRMVMEMLTLGRPVAALHLPQLEAVIKLGKSGDLIPRGPDQIETMARSLIDVALKANSGQLDPSAINSCVQMYTPDSLLSKIFNEHRRLRAISPY